MKKIVFGLAVLFSLACLTACGGDDDAKCYTCTGDGGVLADRDICEGDPLLETGGVTLDQWVDGFEIAGGMCTEK